MSFIEIKELESEPYRASRSRSRSGRTDVSEKAEDASKEATKIVKNSLREAFPGFFALFRSK